MSRIYEALQKAESERKPGRPSDLTDREIPRPEDLAGIHRTSRVAFADYEQPVPLPVDHLYPGEGTVSPAQTTLDLNDVPRRLWTPSYEWLPALLERGAAVEQFRSLRSRIHELRDISPLKSILVTSGLPQEGKSFVTTNLAISLARHKNSKVLLIDGDMRR